MEQPQPGQQILVFLSLILIEKAWFFWYYGQMKGDEKEAVKTQTINDKELEVLEFWRKENIFFKSLFENKKSDSYTFYDGPPFATGLPHHGHLLQSFLKDSIPRYQTMKGKYVRRVWGWDTHGLPIENLIEKELGYKNKSDIEKNGVANFTKAATLSVLRYEEEWKKIIPRLGRWADMDNAYLTITPTYTESCWWAFSELYKKGLAYEGYKVMHICPRCETPLAASEVALNYQEVKDISVYVKFELVDEPGTFLLAWTTTPWTLPGNIAIAINKDIKYVKAKAGEDIFVIAKDLCNKVLGEVEIIKEFDGAELVGKKYKPVFDYYNNEEEFAKMKNIHGENNSQNIYKVWHADFVTADAGTGIAHEAPAFGEDDYNLAIENNVPAIIHLGMDGRFYDIVSDFKGERVKWKGETQATDKKICEFLKEKNLILKTEIITHSYPLCWRCDTPLLNYATNSWFISVSRMRENLVSENKKVYWIPENVRDGRMGQWLEGARDWAVSRNRYWGAPLPVWKKHDKTFFIPESLKELREMTKSKNKYIFIRHGQTDANIKQLIDVVNSESEGLNEKGKKQIHDAGEKLKTKKIDIIVTSPYKRALETANLLADSLGIPREQIIVEEKIREFQVGSVNEGKTWEHFYKENPDANLLHEKLNGCEESKLDLANRVALALYDLEDKYEGKNILLVTHKSPIACMEVYNSGILYEKGTKNVPTFRNIENAEIVEIDFKPLPHDESGAVNFHLPYIDDLKVYDGEFVMKREGGVFDCWFESGSMPYAQFHYPFENEQLFKNNFPAEFIAEAQDQTRGWFYTMLILGVGLFGQSPFKSVITSGMINAGDGKKMSKSLKNFTDPMELVEKYGSDSIRYYILSSPVVKGESVKFTDENIRLVYSKNITRLLNVLSFYNMFKGGENILATADSDHVLDKYILSRLKQIKHQVTNGFETLKVDEAFRPIEKFIDDLSVWYLRRSRDRFKSDDESEVKKVLETTKYILQNFAKVLAPIMPFTADMIWREVRDITEPVSVHLSVWGEAPECDTEGVKNIEAMEEVRNMTSKILDERIKAKIKVRQPLQSATFPKNNILVGNSELENYLKELKEETNIKEILWSDNLSDGEVVLDIKISEELKKEGTYRELVRMIQDKRKEEGLLVSDSVSVVLLETMGEYEKAVVENMKDSLMKECGLANISYGLEFKIVK